MAQMTFANVLAAGVWDSVVEAPARERRRAGQAMNRQTAAVNAAERQRKENERIAEANLNRDRQRAAQNAKRSAAQGRNSTILTGPLGLGGSNSGGKTLLGT